MIYVSNYGKVANGEVGYHSFYKLVITLYPIAQPQPIDNGPLGMT